MPIILSLDLQHCQKEFLPWYNSRCRFSLFHVKNSVPADPHLKAWVNMLFQEISFKNNINLSAKNMLRKEIFSVHTLSKSISCRTGFTFSDNFSASWWSKIVWWTRELLLQFFILSLALGYSQFEPPLSSMYNKHSTSHYRHKIDNKNVC